MVPKSSKSNASSSEGTYILDTTKQKCGKHFTLEADAITLQANNFIANFNHQKSYPHTLYKPMVQFFIHGYLGRALVEFPSRLHHNFHREFWYTTNVNPDNNITLTMLIGAKEITLDLSNFRSIIGLDYLKKGDKFADIKRDIDTNKVLQYIWWAPTEGSQMIQKKEMTATWRYFFTNIIQDLGGSFGGHDQVNSFQMEMVYYLFKHSEVDYAQWIYDDLVVRISSPIKERMCHTWD